MDLSSISDALSNIDISRNDNTTNYIDYYTTILIIEMSEQAAGGFNNLSYTLNPTYSWLIKEIIKKLLSYFPDIIINANENDIIIDWS